MANDARWSVRDTNTHQDHVVAHVIGTTPLGYFHAGEAIHLLLDIGLVWTIYQDGEMGLVPQTVAITEMSTSEEEQADLLGDARLLDEMGSDAAAVSLKRMVAAPVACLIEQIEFYMDEKNNCRIFIRGEKAGLTIEELEVSCQTSE